MTEDEKVFGVSSWVYCRQHLNAHQTGWCSVSNDDKIGLGVIGNDSESAKKALQKCRDFGFVLYRDTTRSAH